MPGFVAFTENSHETCLQVGVGKRLQLHQMLEHRLVKSGIGTRLPHQRLGGLHLFGLLAGLCFVQLFEVGDHAITAAFAQQSLQGALHAGGVRTAITSLWKVGDQATQRLMKLFYGKLWGEGLGKADALWQAKKALAAEGYAPKDWAGWVLTGSPD